MLGQTAIPTCGILTCITELQMNRGFAVNDQDPRRVLVGRLRTFREQDGPARKVKQSEFAEALGGHGRRSVSVPLTSSWESQTNPKVPPTARLQNIATFFAARRSLDGRVSRPVSTEEMTAPEREVRDQLLDELIRRPRLDGPGGAGNPAPGCGALRPGRQPFSIRGGA
jgi:hypothetical protein